MAKINDLDKLIEQILSEVKITSKDDIKFSDTIKVQGAEQTPSSIFKVLAKIKDPQGELDDEDFKLLQTQPELIDTDIERKLIALKIGLKGKRGAKSKYLHDKAVETLAAKQAAIDAAASKEKTITAPRVGKPQAASRGVYSQAQLAILDKVMTGVSAKIDARINKISEISVKYFNAASDPNSKQIVGNPSKILSEIMLLDTLNFIAKDIDAGAGAYLFEYFLAYVSGGEVKGKDPSVASSKMGATDFTDSKNRRGSAKYYSKGSGLTQAKGGFEPNTTTTYVIALKKQGQEQFGKTTRGASNPDRLIAMEVYLLEVKAPKDLSGTFYANGNKIPERGTDLVFDTLLSTATPIPLYISEVYTQTFREMIHKAVGRANKNVKQAFPAMQDFYSSLSQAEEKSRVYIAEGDAQYGLDVIEQLEQSEQHFQQLATVISGAKLSALPVTETKLSELDKLIAEVLKQNT